ncbi:MAG: hypothetical protein KKH08_03410, partial [Candidatus Omnitrophica bacterium]|nr:hypothetical protein [Candidatus Omnitrophota bacterium]
MLDWQNKKWIKVIAVTVVVTFLVYDVAWAMDFSPMAISSAPSASSQGLIPRISDFVSKNILKRTQIQDKSETTEILFRTQLVPHKRYGESSGFLRKEATENAIKRQMDFIRRHQRIETERINRDFTIYKINRGLYMDNVEKAQEAQNITQQVMKARGDTFESAAALSEFNYTINKDGSKIYYKDGLPSRILNEPVYDSIGQFSVKNTYNMAYSGRRLLLSYDSDITDSLGSVTKIQWRNGTYSDDSVWYASDDSAYGKYLTGYTEYITDSYGTMIVREWSATRDSYSGKKVTSYTEIIKDATGAIVSTSDWYNGTYDGDNLVGYNQTSTDAYGNVTLTTWSGKFENGRMIESSSIDEQINADNTTSVSKNKVTYSYDPANELTGASGSTDITGEAKDANGLTIYTYSGKTSQHYEILNGQLKPVYTETEMDQVNADTSTSRTTTRFDYIYNDRNVIVDASEFSKTTGTDIFGLEYTSTTISEYDVIASQPRRTSSDTETTSENIFGDTSKTVSHIEYIYDEMGNFSEEGATGYTDTTGVNLFGEAYSTHTINVYEIINGQPKLITSETTPNAPNPTEDLGTMLSRVEDMLFGIAESEGPEKEEKIQEAAEELGIERESIIDITMDMVYSIIAWLGKASTNVINCAVTALKNIFQGRSVEVEDTEIARQAILIDVLTGVITPENAKGELELSFYSMVKTAENNGVVLNAVNITEDQLKNIITPAIAHVGGDHYVVVTGVSNAQVTYMDSGEEIVKDIDEFMYMFDGNILITDVPVGASVIDFAAMKEIKGADEADATTPPASHLSSSPSFGTEKGTWSPSDDGLWKWEKSDAWQDGDEVWSDSSHYDDGNWITAYTKSAGSYDNGDYVSSTYDGTGSNTNNSYFTKEDWGDGGVHIAMYDDENGGFELFRNKKTAFDKKEIEYHTWTGNRDDPTSYSLTVITGINIYISNFSEVGVSYIDAVNNKDIGVEYATYYSKSQGKVDPKDPDSALDGKWSVTYATIDREAGDIYKIDGLSWNNEGAITTAVSLERVIGGDVIIKEGKEQRSFYAIRNDFSYCDAEGNPIDPFIDGSVVNGNSGPISGWTTTGTLPAGYDFKINYNYDEYGLGLVENLTINIAGSEVSLDLLAFDSSSGELKVVREDAEGTITKYVTFTNPYDTSEKVTSKVTFNISVDKDGYVEIRATYDSYEWTKEEYVKTIEGGAVEGKLDDAKERWIVGDTNGDGYISGYGEGYWDEENSVWVSQDMDGDEVISQTEGYYDTETATWVETSLGLDPENEIKVDAYTVERTKTSNTGYVRFNVIDSTSRSYDLYQNSAAIINALKQAVIDKDASSDVSMYDAALVSGSTLSFTQAVSINEDGIVSVTREYNSLGITQEITGLRVSADAGSINDGIWSAFTVDAGTENALLPYSNSNVSYQALQYGIGIGIVENNVELKLVNPPDNPTISGVTPNYMADPTGVFLASGESPLMITMDADSSEISYILKETQAGAVALYKPEEEVTLDKIRFVSHETDEELYVEYKGEAVVVYMIDAKGVETSIELIADKAYATTRVEPRHSVEMESVLYEDETGTATKTILVQLKENASNALNVSLSLAGNVINRVIEFLKLRMEQLGSGVNNFIEQAGGLDKVADWLKRMGTYVINCAVRALYNTFSKLGVSVSMEDIAVETILSDLSSGRISPDQSPILYTSFYTLHKVAYSKGMDLKLYNISVEDLESIEGPYIAQVGGDHAIVITKVENGIVSLIESDGKLYNVSIEEFAEEFNGFILSNRGPPGAEEVILPLISPITAAGKTLPPEPPVPADPEWTEGAKNWTNITTTSLDGSYTRTDSWVEYEYNANGVLIGAKGGALTWGNDIFGNTYYARRTDIYTIVLGETKIESSVTVTDSVNIDGTESISVGIMNYSYDASTGTLVSADCTGTISFDKFSKTEGELDEDDLAMIEEWIAEGKFAGYLSLLDTDNNGNNDTVAINAANLTVGDDIFGNPFTGILINIYAIIQGEAKVRTSVTITDATAFDGNITHAIATTTYEYTDGTETDEELPAEYFNPDGTLKDEYLDADTGELKIGIIKHIDSDSITEGQDIFGSAYTSTTINTYTFIEGQPRVLSAETTRTDETFMGITASSVSYMEYEYGSYVDPETGRESEISVIGATGYTDASGRDVFGGTYNTHTDNIYAIEKGQPVLVSANSTTAGGSLDLFGCPNDTQSVVTYVYSEVTGIDGRTTSLATSTITTNKFAGEDIFGNSRESTQSQIIASDYGLCDFIDPRTGEPVSYWGIINAVETVPMVTAGIDTFGNSFTVVSTNTFEAGGEHFGKNVGTRVSTVTTGKDMFGASYTTTSNTTNTYALQSDGNGKYAYLTSTAVTETRNVKEDIFGNNNSIVSPEKVTNTYGIIFAPDSLPIWGVTSAVGTNPLVTEGVDIFGNSFTTTTTNQIYECKYGVPVATKVITETSGTNLFGSEYYSKSESINTPELYTESSGRMAYMIMSSVSTSVDNWSEDIFGNKTTLTQGSVVVNTYSKTTGPNNETIWGIVSANET